MISGERRFPRERRMTPARWWQRNSQHVALGSMLLPYLIGLSLLVIGPGLAGFALSLTDYNAIQPPTLGRVG